MSWSSGAIARLSLETLSAASLFSVSNPFGNPFDDSPGQVRTLSCESRDLFPGPGVIAV